MNKSPNSVRAILALAILWAASATAEQPAHHLDDKSPWGAGVSQERQQMAAQLLEAGNDLLNDSLFADAEEKYGAALSYWDHPALHYNLALAIPSTLRPTEVYDHLLAATKYGEAPLGAERFKYARKLVARMEQEYAWVELSCDCEASATLASGRWLVRRAEGRFAGLVPPGTHTLVATPKGHPTTERTLTLTAGRRTQLQLDARRPWAAWKPWAILGAGVTAAAAGQLLHIQARSHIRTFDEGIKSCGGCVPDQDLADQRARGITSQRLSTGAYALGGAAFLTGLVLVFTNQLQSQITPVPQSDPSLVIAPVFGGGAEGLQATFRF